MCIGQPVAVTWKKLGRELDRVREQLASARKVLNEDLKAANNRVLTLELESQQAGNRQALADARIAVLSAQVDELTLQKLLAWNDRGALQSGIAELEQR